MKRNEKYNYVRVSRTTEHGSRTYDVNGTKLPSVTTILDKTKDKSYLDKWRARVGTDFKMHKLNFYVFLMIF